MTPIRHRLHSSEQLRQHRCRLQGVFNNGPEAPRTRNIEVPAGKHKNATAKFNREIIKMRIN
jgi:hypothetical protein